MRTLSKFALTASLVLALALTFSCSSGGGSGEDTPPLQEEVSSSSVGTEGVSSSSIGTRGASSSSIGTRGVSSSGVGTGVSSSSVGTGVSSSSVGTGVSSSSVATGISSSGVTTYTVTFNSNGGSEVSSITGLERFTKITKPADPIKTGTINNVFIGWYENIGLTKAWNFATDEVLGNMTLYAKWGSEYAIGDTGPGGGKIFYRSEVGFTVEGYSGTGTFASRSYESYTAHYLEVAPENLSNNRVWSPNNFEISGVTTFTDTLDALASKIGDGRKNTWLIAEYLNSVNEDGAAKDCYNSTIGGKNDWFLPSFKELSELYSRRTLLGDNSGDDFWSSSQYDGNYAWRYYFGFNSRGYSNKATTSISTRAVRAF